ncbi:glucuronate isomerase [Treponema bryantii]|uniref:glucuronate isomerase n=1 Tax=Treponema bryantii TaxID=163 RepID=UPI0003B56C24|nr:glucuronate isomerase [Treponema bryantii]
MKTFLDEDFILQSEAAQTLYHKYAENQPIFDFHNHLSPLEIFENKPLGNLANAWLDHDHYKWRAMRAAGVDEKLITGHLNKDGSVKPVVECPQSGRIETAEYDYNRYLAFVRTLQLCPGNPLYHWSHLELKRYFGIDVPVTEKNAREIWDKCNALLAKAEYSPRGLLEKMNVRELCTTDDPLDTLEWHKKIAGDWKNCKVRPSFRPDIPLSPENPAYPAYISRLQEMDGTRFTSINDMIAALGRRMDFFKTNGSVVSDHSLEGDFYLPTKFDDVNYIFEKAWIGKKLRPDEIAQYKGWVLTELGKLYAQKGFVMQIHIGALRDNNFAMLSAAGKNIGEDSLNDFNFAPQLGAVLNAIYSAFGGFDKPASQALNHRGPRTILYNLNPKDNEALATMAANFRNCQFGPAWWFNDHKDGIEEQLRVYARTAPLGSYVGMLTDSRSFLSYPRHEYFRRILCNFVGNLVEQGEFPWDEENLGELVKRICYENSIEFFKQ